MSMPSTAITGTERKAEVRSQKPEVRNNNLHRRRSSYRTLFSVLCLLGPFFCLLFSTPLVDAQQKQEASQQAAKTAKQAPLRSLEEERLNILRADIQSEMEKYRKLKKDIEEAQKALDIKNEEKLKKLGKMYEAMASDEAARKLEKLDDETAVTILGSIKPKAAGKILAQMENEKAATLSKRILSKGTIPQEKTSP